MNYNKICIRNFFKSGYFFQLTNGLLYNVLRDNKRRLCIKHKFIINSIIIIYDKNIISAKVGSSENWIYSLFGIKRTLLKDILNII